MKKRCAVCGDTCQSNLVFKWKRDLDDVIFHICGMCAEGGKVNKDSVQKISNKTYTTYIKE